MEPIRSEFKLEEAEFVEVSGVLQARSIRSKPWLLAILFLFPVWLCFLLWDSLFPIWLVLLISALASVYFFFALKRGMRRAARKLYRNNFRNQEPVRFSADENGYVHEGATYRTSTDWNKVLKVGSYKGYYLLYLTPINAHAVPAASFTTEDRAAFEALLDRMKPGWRS